jgi:CBS domain containing-hemolysin-like protein
MTELILAVSLAVSISAVCSLFEAVLYSVPLRHIEAMVQAGKPGARILKNLRRHVERPISAILSLNTIANTAGAAFAGAAATAVFGHQWLGYFSALFTLAILLFSEIIPKTAGVVYGSTLVTVVAYPLRGLVWVMTPAIWLSGLMTRMISRGKREEAITAEEIQLMARLSRRAGGILFYQEQTIRRILTLQEKMAKDVMTPRTVVFSLSENLTLKESIAAAGGWEHSRIPVYDKGIEDVVGVVHTREILIAFSEGNEDKRLAELMRPIHFVAETARLNEVLSEFLESRQHLFAVIDEYGGLSGLISLEDILEEILGREIVDESDEVTDKQEFARRKQVTKV